MKINKRTKLLLIVIAFTISASAQSISPEVIASSGDYFENATTSISWTLGEIAGETFSTADIILTQGFQQPLSVTITGINLDLLVFLEGPFSETQMVAHLNDENQIPLSQPFNTPPWNYMGTESVEAIPNSEIIDWVLIELRDAPSAGSADPSTIIAKQAAFLLTNGSVVGLDGTSSLQFPLASISQNLFAAVWHRNHLGIISANGIQAIGGVYNYDFSTEITQVYNGGSGYKEIAPEIYGMVGGDSNADGFITAEDLISWGIDVGTKGYKATDYNMDIQVNNEDKNDIWVDNQPYSSQIPE